MVNKLFSRDSVKWIDVIFQGFEQKVGE